MDLSIRPTNVTVALEELKVLVVQKAKQHPIAAIALAILFPVALAAAAIWVIRKVVVANLGNKSPVAADQNKHFDLQTLKDHPWFKTSLVVGGIIGVAAVGLYYYSKDFIPGDAPNDLVNNNVTKPIETLLNLPHNNVSSLADYFLKSLNDANNAVVNLANGAQSAVSRISEGFNATNFTNVTNVANTINVTNATNNSVSEVLNYGPSIEHYLNTSSIPQIDTNLIPPEEIRSAFSDWVEYLDVAQAGAFLRNWEYNQEGLMRALSMIPIAGFALSTVNKKSHEVDKNGKTSLSKLYSWQALGVLGGSAIGTMANLFSNSFTMTKSTSAICQPLQNIKYFPEISAISQSTIKGYFGAVSNTIPEVIAWCCAKKIQRRKQTAADRQKTDESISRLQKSMAKTLLMSLIGSGLKLSLKTFVPVPRGGFDPSGHMMLKAGALHGLISAQQHDNGSLSYINTAFAVGSVAMDLLFLTNTAGCHHSPFDIAAGLAYGMAAYGLADLAVNRLSEAYAARFPEVKKAKPVKMKDVVKAFKTRHQEVVDETLKTGKHNGYERVKMQAVSVIKNSADPQAQFDLLENGIKHLMHSQTCTGINLLHAIKRDLEVYHKIVVEIRIKVKIV